MLVVTVDCELQNANCKFVSRWFEFSCSIPLSLCRHAQEPIVEVGNVIAAAEFSSRSGQSSPSAMVRSPICSDRTMPSSLITLPSNSRPNQFFIEALASSATPVCQPSASRPSGSMRMVKRTCTSWPVRRTSTLPNSLAVR